MARPRPSLFANRLVRLLRRARLGKDRARIIAFWQAQQTRGEALERLRASPDWTVLQEVLRTVQDEVDAPLKDLRSTADHRLIAAAQWCAVEAVRRELEQAIAYGKTARDKLATLSGDQTPDAGRVPDPGRESWRTQESFDA